MEYIDLKPKEFENIALSFSGGGFRAASYSLGCLSYLDSVRVEDRKMTDIINFISSASGGTITNLSYTASKRNAQTFLDFYLYMKDEVLKGTKLFDRAFEILQSDEVWKERPEKSRNIINAFSIVYDEMIFAGETFSVYWKQAEGAIPEVCANTTEFDNGMLFRFQNAGVAGNKFLCFKSETSALDTLKKVKLGDILACSSCFTVGFEPFMFPRDFTYDKLSKTALEISIKQKPHYSPSVVGTGAIKFPCFGLMDGGIDDNQGIDSFIRAEERLQNRNNFGHDLYIACDVSSNYTDGYNFPEENGKSWWQKLSLIQYGTIVLLLTGLSIAGVLSKTFVHLSFCILGICSVLLLLFITLSIKGFRAYKKSVWNKNTYGLLILPHIFFFLKLRLSALLQILDSRATSAGYLSAVVFLKKIRRISYDRLFEKITERKLKADGIPWKSGEDEMLVDKLEMKRWRQFSLQNAVYLLSPKNDEQRLTDLKGENWYRQNPIVSVNGRTMNLIDLMKPTAELQDVARLATEMDTTLWYDTNHEAAKQPEALIATGQFTTCYNLLRYAYRFDSGDPYWAKIQNQLTGDWDSFNQSPYSKV